MEVKTRRQAAADGDAKYWTGKPCSKNHESPRYTTTGICCRCNAEAARAYNARMRKAVNARAQGHFSYALHPDDHAAALAYCQGLDLQRGRLPQSPGVAPAPAGAEITPDQMRAMRAAALGKVVDIVAAEPRTDVAEAWLRDC